MVCGNSVNVRICNRGNIFVDEILKVSNQHVATIGGKGLQSSGIRTVKQILRDDSRKSHKYLVEDVLFFPQSLINIMSITYVARQLNDLTGTGIYTKQLQYHFYRESNKFSLTIQHPPSNLPEISINEGFSLSTIFCALILIVVNVSNHTRYGCCFSNIYSDDYNKYLCTDKLGKHSK